MSQVGMETYKQETKNISRKIIWDHSIKSLTNNREHIRVLRGSYVKKLWKYCERILNSELNKNLLDNWLGYAESRYGKRKTSELKVAFFCGPEPENDVECLLNYGVRLENMYAFEYDNKIFKTAVNSLHEKYPQLKIVNGKIEIFAELHLEKFDIIYLDFTKSIVAERNTIYKLLDNNTLSDLGILIVNTCYDDSTDENIDSLTNYFFYKCFFEGTFIDGFDWRVENCNSCDIDFSQLRDSVASNFEKAYSAFQTSIVLEYANLIKPAYSLINNRILAKRVFNYQKFSDILANKKLISEIELSSYESDEFLLSTSYADFNFEVKEKHYSRMDCMRLMEIFLNSQYYGNNRYRESFVDGEIVKTKLEDIDWNEFLSAPLMKAIPEINSEIKKRGRSLFCDIPMIHLWLEIIVNRLGYVYHSNIQNHHRFDYQAKTRKMCTDIFTFDKCRAFYDWLPMIEFYGEDLKQIDRQMLSRICVDAISKHSLHILEQQYYGSALIGANERKWSCNFELPGRYNLNEMFNKES